LKEMVNKYEHLSAKVNAPVESAAASELNTLRSTGAPLRVKPHEDPTSRFVRELREKQSMIADSQNMYANENPRNFTLGSS